LQGTRKTATFETLKPQDLRHFGDRWGTIVRTINFSSASALDAGETVDEYFRLKSLANAGFAKEALRKVTDVILPLNDSGTGPAFYCVHDITGIATGFRFIAEMLGPRQRFYGIQAPTKKRNAEFASSIESISQYYVDDLIKFQPEGNFLLGGYSTGAVIALQMAQQLRARGREVSLLVVFDGDLFNSGAEIKSRDPFDRLELIWNLPRWITAVVKEGYSFQTVCRKAINKAIAAPKAIMAKMRGEVATFELTAENFVSINLNHCSPEHVAFINRLFAVQFEYIPEKYSGRVLVCAARTQGPARLRQVAAAWRKVAPASEIVEVRGTHITMMRPPDGYAVAKHLAARIAEINRVPT
jgi:thioesterase domain-containing protein